MQTFNKMNNVYILFLIMTAPRRIPLVIEEHEEDGQWRVKYMDLETGTASFRMRDEGYLVPHCIPVLDLSASVLERVPETRAEVLAFVMYFFNAFVWDTRLQYLRHPDHHHRAFEFGSQQQRFRETLLSCRLCIMPDRDDQLNFSIAPGTTLWTVHVGFVMLSQSPSRVRGACACRVGFSFYAKPETGEIRALVFFPHICSELSDCLAKGFAKCVQDEDWGNLFDVHIQ